MKRLCWVLIAGLLSCGAGAAQADVKLGSVFGDHMVLQRDKNDCIWGTADSGEKITVQVAGQVIETTADSSGQWIVRIKPLRAAAQVSLVVAGKNTITLNDIAVGDVYLCSGQSNMQFAMVSAINGAQDIAAANYPYLRLFTAPQTMQGAPLADYAKPAAWSACTPQSTERFSAVAYYFGRELHRRLGVPIGLINAPWSGTVAAAWVSRETLAEMPDYAATLATVDVALSLPPGQGNNPNQPTVLYNGMIAPLVPFGLRGVIWYQGEQNADGGGIAYRSLFQALIMDWRRHFGQGDLPFYFVQLPNYRARSEAPEESEWAVLREAQAMALALPRTGMAVTIDVGEAANIHPRDKFDVGYRLALNALALDYGYKIEYSGPMFQRLKREGHRLRVVFSHADGLVTKDGKPPTAFAIAGADQKYVWANARIEGNSVVLWNDAVALPRSVRYAWATNPDVNLYNSAALPAAPFRSDGVRRDIMPDLPVFRNGARSAVLTGP